MIKFKKFPFKKIVRLFLNHIYILLLIPLIFIIDLLLGPGIVMTGDFPVIETSLYSHKFFFTWTDYGSYYSFETLSRYPFLALGYILQTINIGPDIISKSLVVLGFFSALFSFYFACVSFFRNTITRHIFTLRIGAMIGSLFYAFNVWSFHRMHHWYLWLGYAILPLFFISLIYSLKNPKNWKYPIFTVLIWSVASSTPHMVIFYGIFYLVLSIFFLLRNLRKRNEKFIIIRPILLTISLYLVLNLYWIYPYVLYIANSGDISIIPSILVTEERTEYYSTHSSYLTVLRLTLDWWKTGMADVSPPDTSLLYPVWLISSFIFPILALSSLFLKRNLKKILMFSMIGIIGILLTMGTNAPFNFYSIFLFGLSLPSILQYLFRDPDKWGFLIAFAFSFLLSITTFELLKKVNKLRHGKIISGCILTLILTALIVYVYPIYNTTSQLIKPITLPSDFEKLGAQLRTLDTEKVFYILQDYVPTEWSNGGDVNYLLYQQSSTKPNIGDYLISSQNYINHLIDSIISNKTNNISNFIYPLGTSYVIFNNDTITDEHSKILRELSLLQEFENIFNIGLFKIFKAGNGADDKFYLRIPRQNIILGGGLDLFSSLNHLPSFSTINSSLYFLDQNLNNDEKNETLNLGDYLVLSKNTDDLILSLLDKKFVIAPFDKTNHREPSAVWSKAGSMDPLHGVFHPVLKDLGIDNWDFDYGRGLVITDAIGANLSIPIEIENPDKDGKKEDMFHLFMRYLKSQRGGGMNIYLDGKLVDTIDTVDRISNNFLWKKLASVNLTSGKHILTLQNIGGFNSVNIFALVPDEELKMLKTQTANLLRNKIQVIQLLEAETNFYNNKGKETGSSNYLSYEGDNFKSNESNQNGTTRSFKGQFKVPTNADLAALEFFAIQNNTINSNYSIKDIKINSVDDDNNVFTSDFERTKRSPSKLHQYDHLNFTNQKKDLLFRSIETNRTTDGNQSLKVNVEQGNFSHWGVLSTDFIPANDITDYNLTLDISAKDVKQLHSKVFYYDADKKEINEEVVFDGRDGTFEQGYKKILSVPLGAKYIRLQMWTSPNANTPSSYLLDNVELVELREKLIPSDWVVNQKDLLSAYIDRNKPIDGNGSLKVNVEQGNFSHQGIISTDFIPANDITDYNLTLDVSAKDVKQLHSKAFYYDANKKEIDEEVVFDGRDGTFEQGYKKILSVPLGAKYIKLQMWTSPNANTPSSYLLDNVVLRNVDLRKTIGTGVVLEDKFTRLQNVTSEAPDISVSMNDNNTNNDINLNTENLNLKTMLSKGNSTNITKLVTKAFPVNSDSVYNYTFTLEMRNMSILYGVVSFRNSSDVAVNSDIYGNNASNGGVLSLSPGSEVITKLNIVKPSNYTIALKTKNCDSCTFLKINLERDDVDNNDDHISTTSVVPIKNKTSAMRWSYSNNVYLKEGTYQLGIYSDSQTELDTVAVYSTDKTNNMPNTLRRNATIQDLFNPSVISPPAYISGYKKIDPTKFIVYINNATRPYTISFAETYDPLWTAYVNKEDANESNPDNTNNAFKVNTIPLYSVVNGFHVNKTGNYSLTIEYRPQSWFIQAGTVSLVALMGIIVIFFIDKYYCYLVRFKNYLRFH